MKTLKQVMGDLGGYQPKPEGEQNFVKKHVVNKKEDMNGNKDDVFKATNIKTADRPGERHGYTDEDDDKINEDMQLAEVSSDLLKRYVTKAVADIQKRADAGESSKPKTTDRAKKVVWAQMMRKYKIIGEEESNDHEDLEEKTLTPAELKKREEIAKAIERENPGIDMSKKMAIATAQAKKVAESVEDKKKPAAGKGVPPTGAYDSIPLGITVAKEDITHKASLLEMFISLDEEERQMFLELQESDLLDEVIQEIQ